jgi:hypothetical protein
LTTISDHFVTEPEMSSADWSRVRIPDSCRGVDIVIGIDEAGRGPVLGPLVYAAAFWPVSEDAAIQKMGFNDSKQLKESDRDGFFQSIRNHPSIGWVIEEISAADISRVGGLVRLCIRALWLTFRYPISRHRTCFVQALYR